MHRVAEMGQGLSWRHGDSQEGGGLFISALKNGDLEVIRTLAETNPSALTEATALGSEKLSPLHVAAAHGQIEVLSILLDRPVNPDALNRHKQVQCLSLYTPLMLAAMHGKTSCVIKLIEAGANILMFDSEYGRTCLHYAAYYGHSDCLQTILSAARSSPVADSWGFTRFVNIRDINGSSPLHLAARQGRAECIRILLHNGAFVSASTGGYGRPGDAPLHFAARSGSLDCVRELLAWGADRLQMDSSGRIAYRVAMKHKNKACAALLNPSSAEPLFWPSPQKFISELNPETKVLLEQALMEANSVKDQAALKEMVSSLASNLNSDIMNDDNPNEISEVELCRICFDQVCMIEVKPCGHQMCAHCILALCCHKKANPTSAYPTAPLCPFCRTSITQLALAQNKTEIQNEP